MRSSPADSCSAPAWPGSTRTGAIPDGIEAQTEQALTNLRAVLAAAGASMDDLVKTTIYYTNVGDFPVLNDVYARHMPTPPPRPLRTRERSAPATTPRLIDAIAVHPG